MYLATLGSPFEAYMLAVLATGMLVGGLFMFAVAWWRVLANPVDVWKDWGLSRQKGYSYASSWRGQRP